jgi:zinc protease
MKNHLLLLFTIFFFISNAQDKKYPEIDIPYSKYVLENGLTLIVHEDHKVPLASFNIWYHVGSKNEKPGKTGFAHLFEHIMFTSTEHWSNFDEVLQTVGGSTDGSTNYDRTNYYETFSSSGLERVLWLEADRMGFLLKGLDSVKVDIQRGVVQNEKRQWENQPYAVAEELTVKSTYPANHPYSWSVIGSMEDLSAASLEDVKEWFRTYYGPNNAIVCIAGDVSAAEVLEKVKKYFGDIPASPPISKHSQWIAKMSGKQVQVAQDRVAQANLSKTWNIPGWGDQETTYLSLLGNILTNGKSSRLYKRLVYDTSLASDVSFYSDEREIGSQFNLYADVKPGVDLNSIDAIMTEELAKIFSTGITPGELERAKTDYFVSFISSMEQILDKSEILAACETYGGSPDYFKKIHGWIKAATPEDIRKAAMKWLSDGEYVLKIVPYGEFRQLDSQIDRKIMPPVSPPADTKFPAVKDFTLSNGLKVYLAERHDVPTVLVDAAVNAGFASDPTKMEGLARLTGNMLLEGTTTKSSTQISDILLDLGSELHCNSTLDNTYLSLRSIKANFDASLAIFTDVLLHPAFPQKDFERVQHEQLLLVKQEQSDPRLLANRVMPGLIYGKEHPYGQSSGGTGSEASIQRINKSLLVGFHETWFAPNNTSLFVTGDITEKELRQKLESQLAGWKTRALPQKNIPAVAPAERPVVYIIDKPEAIQSRIMVAEICTFCDETNHDAIEFMNTLIGGSFLSRINMNLREDKHWSYGAHSYIQDNQGPDVFIVSTSVQTDKTKESLIEILKELTEINTTKPISQDEFKTEQTNSILSVAGNWETLESVQRVMMDMVEHHRGNDYANNYTSVLKKFTKENIQSAANGVIKPQNLTWLIIGDRKTIEAGIRALDLGPVQVLDANGN